MKERVKFYSSHDLSYGYNMKNAEKILESYNDEIEYSDVNDILEFYNIQLYLEDGYLESWNQSKRVKYNTISKNFNGKIGRFYAHINDQNLDEIYRKINIEYFDDFWKLFEKYKVYEKISSDVFEKINHDNLHFCCILSNKKLVKAYDQTIAKLMLDDIKSCEVLLDEYLVMKDNEKNYYFPSSLNKDVLLVKYIESNIAHPNYLNLIAQPSSERELVIKDEIRLLAKRRYKKEVEEIFKTGSVFGYGVKVAFSDTQNETVVTNWKNNNLILSYSKAAFNECLDYPVLLIYNFMYIFEFVDRQVRFLHVNEIKSMSPLECVFGIKGKNEYFEDMSFNQMQIVANAQMKFYYQFLETKHILLEELCKWFFEEYLKSEFNVCEYIFNSPSIGSTYLEKIRFINSELDSILKQYCLWCKNKKIDHELLQISSTHLFYNVVPSLIDKKYFYSNDSELNSAAFLLCSNQSRIKYISGKHDYKDKFYELIKDYDLRINNFHEYQHKDLRWLIEKEYIYENEEGYLKYNPDLIWVIDQLYFKEVISYHHLSKKRQNIVDKLLEKGVVKYENTLFSKPEYNYLNYIFNKKEFSNGLDIRNKYIHGTQSNNISDQEEDYYICLRMLVLCILKINDEFCIEYKLNDEKSNY